MSLYVGPAITKRIVEDPYQSARPQCIIYVPLLVNIFQQSILLIVQYKYLKSCSVDLILQNLLLNTRSCDTAFIMGWL